METMSPDQLAAELRRRGCRLFHAINLPDFRTYAQLAALVSRQELLKQGLGTPFASDESDKARGLFDRCFGNLADFGIRFWKHSEAPPNVYGPILLVFKPDIFEVTTDAAVTAKNAGAYDFDLVKDRITSAEDLRAIFRTPNGPDLAPFHFFTEFSTATNTLPFDLLDKILVEPLTFNGDELVEAVEKIVNGRWRVEKRPPKPLADKADLLDDLAVWCAERGGTPPGPLDIDNAPGAAGQWWKTMKPWGAGYRWFQYVVSTLKDLSPDEVAAPAPEPPRCDVCQRNARTRCSGCSRWLCFDDYYGISEEGAFDAEAQRRCWECCYDPT